MSDRWDRHFLNTSLLHASMSKDPNTKVGSVIVGRDREVIATGFNGFPRGMSDDYRLFDREVKLKLMVHAEMNALMNAARVGVSTRNCTLYLACTDETGATWGGVPCTRCAMHVIQAGIGEIVYFPWKNVPSKWTSDILESEEFLREAGIICREVPLRYYTGSPDECPF